MIERLKPEQLGVEAGQEHLIDAFIEHDFAIRSGKCPNGCGSMSAEDWGQSCPACSFSCNVRPEPQAMN